LHPIKIQDINLIKCFICSTTTAAAAATTKKTNNIEPIIISKIEIMEINKRKNIQKKFNQ
jgi:hypothetical protein